MVNSHAGPDLAPYTARKSKSKHKVNYVKKGMSKIYHSFLKSPKI